MTWTTAQLQDAGLVRLAEGCVHLLAENATLEFPSSTRAAPSRMVTVALTPKGPMWGGAAKAFPFQVPWNVWQQAVVPVLEDTQHQIRHGDGTVNSYNVDLVERRAWDDLVGRMVGALVDSFQTQGFLPTSTTASTFVAPLTAPGEEVNRTPEIPSDEPYQRFESGQGIVYEQYDT